MEQETNRDKEILKPSVVHADLPKIEDAKQEKKADGGDNIQPENPDRNYHHDAIKNLKIRNHGVGYDDGRSGEDG